MKRRIIAPEFWTDEKIVKLSMPARLLFIGLWQLADDEGRMEWSPGRVKMQIFPGDEIDVAPLCADLRRFALVTIYESQSKEYLQVTNFSKYQKLDKRRKSNYPAPLCADLRRTPALNQNQNLTQPELNPTAEATYTAALPLVSASLSDDFKIFQDAWNALPTPPFPRLSKISPRGDTRGRTLAVRLKSTWWREHYQAALDKMPHCPFLRGEGGRGWVASVTFFLKPESARRILEGEFDEQRNEPKGLAGLREWERQRRAALDAGDRATGAGDLREGIPKV